MTPELPTLSEPIEINGVSFQTVISQAVIPIPEKIADGETCFKSGIRVTNHTSQDYFFFNFPSMLIPYIKLPNGQVLRAGYDTDSVIWPRNSHLVIVESGKSIDLLWNTSLIWIQFHKNIIKNKSKKIRGIPESYETAPKLTFIVPFRSYLILYYPGIEPLLPKPDIYQFRFGYYMQNNLEALLYSKNDHYNSYYRHIIPSVFTRIWIGLVDTLFVAIQVVENQDIHSTK